MGALWHGLVHLLSVGMLVLSRWTSSYGMGIILLTAVIRLLVYPLYRAQIQSFKKMQAMQPELQKMQEKFKEDKQRLMEEQVRLYKEHGVNPMASCLPMLLQLPVLYAFYDMLRVFSFTGHPPLTPGFLWLPDLGKADPYYILPVLGGISTYWQTKISMALQPGGSQQQMQFMSYLMPAIMFYVFLRLPAGLALYWVVANIFTIAQQYVAMR